MLDARAQYPKEAKDASTLDLGFVMENGTVPAKSEPQVHKVWIHAFEMETGDYFWGGFMSLVTEADRWIFHHPDVEDPYADDPPPAAPQKPAKKGKKQATQPKNPNPAPEKLR